MAGLRDSIAALPPYVEEERRSSRAPAEKDYIRAIVHDIRELNNNSMKDVVPLQPSQILQDATAPPRISTDIGSSSRCAQMDDEDEEQEDNAVPLQSLRLKSNKKVQSAASISSIRSTSSLFERLWQKANIRSRQSSEQSCESQSHQHQSHQKQFQKRRRWRWFSSSPSLPEDIDPSTVPHVVSHHKTVQEVDEENNSLKQVEMNEVHKNLRVHGLSPYATSASARARTMSAQASIESQPYSVELSSIGMAKFYDKMQRLESHDQQFFEKKQPFSSEETVVSDVYPSLDGLGNLEPATYTDVNDDYGPMTCEYPREVDPPYNPDMLSPVKLTSYSQNQEQLRFQHPIIYQRHHYSDINSDNINNNISSSRSTFKLPNPTVGYIKELPEPEFKAMKKQIIPESWFQSGTTKKYGTKVVEPLSSKENKKRKHIPLVLAWTPCILRLDYAFQDAVVAITTASNPPSACRQTPLLVASTPHRHPLTRCVRFQCARGS